MAGASMNDIKARMKSVTSTMQITKAMELVATSKLRRAKERVESVRPYLNAMREAIETVVVGSDDRESPFLKDRAIHKTLYIVIAGDRGLAGGYNSNVFRLAAAAQGVDGKDALYLPIGKKAYEYYKHHSLPILTEGCLFASALGVGDCMKLGHRLTEGYLNGSFDRIVLVYTRFASMMSQIPIHEVLLPLTVGKSSGSMAETDETAEELLSLAIPNYLGGILFSALCESLASESGARRSAMNSANKNAKEMIDALSLSYNRARQAQITQEITEIVSGAEAL